MAHFRRRATFEEKAKWAKDGGLYPLHGFVREGGVDYPLEDLRASWSRPDPVWEVHAPDMFRFSGMATHSILCESIADAISNVGHYPLERCRDILCPCGDRR